MTQEEHIAAVEQKHREHEERFAKLLESQREMLSQVMAMLVPPNPDPKAVKRAKVRRRFEESCAMMDALSKANQISESMVSLSTVREEGRRLADSRIELLAMDAEDRE